jgi:two-component system, LytTR family, response regulator
VGKHRLKVLILDDDEFSILDLRNKLLLLPYEMEITELKSAQNILEFFKDSFIDVLFLDINLGEYNGIRIANYISEKHPYINIIFTTGHPEYALDGYDSNPIDFLTKPIDTKRLERTFLRLINEKNKKMKIGINTSGSMKFINIDEILYIEKSLRKCVIHLIGGEAVETFDTINKLENILINHKFYRPHQSYLVSLNRITEVKKDNFMRSYNIYLSDCDEIVKLSKKKYSELKELLIKYECI